MAEPLGEEQQHKHRQAVREFMPTTPFLAGPGIVFDRYEPDDVTIRLPYRDDLPTTAPTFTAGSSRR